MANMTKAKLLDNVAQYSGVAKVDAEAVLDAFFDTATVAAHGKDQVSWPGFGSFKGVSRKARMARNPRTGAPVPVQARTVMKFTPSSTLNETLKAAKAPTIKKAAKKRPAAKKATKKSAKKKATKKSAKKATKKSAKKSTKKSPRKTAKKSARGRKR